MGEGKPDIVTQVLARLGQGWRGLSDAPTRANSEVYVVPPLPEGHDYGGGGKMTGVQTNIASESGFSSDPLPEWGALDVLGRVSGQGLLRNRADRFTTQGIDVTDLEPPAEVNHFPHTEPFLGQGSLYYPPGEKVPIRNNFNPKPGLMPKWLLDATNGR